MNGFIFILIIFILGLAARSSALTMAAGLLLLLQILNIKSLLPLLEERGVEMGLLFLMIAVLVPVALGRVGTKEVLMTFCSLPGLLAIAGGVIATRLNGMGLNLLESQPQVILGLVIGSIIGIVFLKGVPVGPLMAGGIAAFFLYIIQLFGR
ncbi:MAG: DUF441 domain-containing protein [Bacillota bacterium]|nr:DUF441 domain-containing protein [Bacillota bacterium]